MLGCRLVLEQGTRVECVLTSGVVELEGQPGVSMAVGIASLKQDDLVTVKPARLELCCQFFAFLVHVIYKLM